MELAIGLLTSGFQAITGAAASAGSFASTVGGVAVPAAKPVLGAAAASSGFSLSSLLQGTATVLGAMSAIGAGNAEAEQLDLAAADAEGQKPLETLQGISRRASIKREMADAIGSQDVAFAASGVDLSFGTPGQARKDAFREADYALTSDSGTQEVRTSRLTERAANFRSRARRARSRGFADALSIGLGYGANLMARG
ncbi:MAG: hypothetical protein CML67_02105 [Rhodobacteraceae bacterium]|nr:hypothetical protein [Paracoccaceae bacterium]